MMLFKKSVLFFFFALSLFAMDAQRNAEQIITESSEPQEEEFIDDIVQRRIIFEDRVLPYEPLREADIPWEKRIWRVIDIREKINLPFAYPEMPFITILMDAAMAGDVTVFSAEDDKFTAPIHPEEVASMLTSIDTQLVIDPDTYEEEVKIVRNDMDPTDVKRYRLKEIWYFDKESSRMKVRILGIAPILDQYDDNGNFLFERPMFWIYYPQVRETLSKHRVFNPFNDASPMTWHDVFENRQFSSFIMKESNVLDYRLKDYGLEGVDLLLESEKIKQELFNFEHDLWSY